MGFADHDKVLITHIDDIGFCHAANAASFECLDLGAAVCGSILVNAPWFLEAAAICRDHPRYDVGVHLTLTSEYESYRWPAISSRESDTGLMDEQGYLWRTAREAVKNIPLQAAEIEMRRQIETALQAGIEVTHIDTHMGSVVHPKFLGSYLKLASEFELPAFLPNVTRERLMQISDPEFVDTYAQIIDQVNTASVPTLDEILIDTLHHEDSKIEYYKDLISHVKPGLTHLLFHPTKMGEELAAITPESCAWRNADYLCFTDPNLKQFIDDSEVTLIGYRDLKAYL